MTQERILTIQDISCVGRCSLTVALPILSAAGLETSILPTAVLSTHTGGFEGYTYRDLTTDIKSIAEHWRSLGLTFSAIYTGYLGSFEQLDLVSAIFDEFKTPDGTILVDPVMADNGVLYGGFDAAFPAGMAKLCGKADVIVPNLTEAAFMLGERYVGDDYDREYIDGLLKRLRKLDAPNVVLTGVSFEPGTVGVATFDGDDVTYYATKRVDGYFHGTGDIYASAFLAYYRKALSKSLQKSSGNQSGKSDALKSSAAKAADFTLACIERKLELGGEARYGVPFELELGRLI
jgi:pyridoxine kinase